MSALAIRCGKCQVPLPETFYGLPDLSPCPSCASEVRVEIFPARHRALAAASVAEDILTGEEAGCFHHPEKRAVVSCEECGRFLCGLCDCEIGGQHLCPACLQTGQTKGKIKKLENRRMLWDRVALALAVLPMLVFYATIVTAPAALYISFRYWKTPGGIIPTSKLRFVLAILIAGLQVLGWVGAFGAITYAIMRH